MVTLSLKASPPSDPKPVKTGFAYVCVNFSFIQANSVKVE